MSSDAFLAGMGLALMLRAIWTWRGVWRWLAVSPLLAIAAYIPIAIIIGTYDPAFMTNWMVILKLIFYAGVLVICLLWVTRGLIRLATEF